MHPNYTLNIYICPGKHEEVEVKSSRGNVCQYFHEYDTEKKSPVTVRIITKCISEVGPGCEFLTSYGKAYADLAA